MTTEIPTRVRPRQLAAPATLTCPRCERPVEDEGLCVRCYDAEVDADWHGTLHGYTGRGCRCELCATYFAAWKRDYRARQKAEAVPSGE